MLPTTVLDRFVEHFPAAVMVRLTLERLLTPTRLDAIFTANTVHQSEHELLFSELVALMVGVATRTHQSVHAAYLAARDRLGGSAAALYGKLNRLDPAITAAVIRGHCSRHSQRHPSDAPGPPDRLGWQSSGGD